MPAGEPAYDPKQALVPADVTYTLEAVGGQPLPAMEWRVQGRQFVAVRGTLTLHAGGTYTESHTVRVVDVSPRPPAEREDTRGRTGRWAAVDGRHGPAVELTPDPLDPPLPANSVALWDGHKPLLYVLDGGQVLEGDGAPYAIFRYRRVPAPRAGE